MQPTIVPGVATWSRWQADRAMYFNAWFVTGEGANFVVDPLEPDADDLAYIDERGLAAVVVTNRDHERAAALFAQRYHVPVFAALPDSTEMVVAVERTVAHDDMLFGWRVVGFDGFKTPGEFALFHRATRSAITGDAFWGVPAGALRLMPDEKLEDPARAALSARQLLALGVRHLLVGDGMPIFNGAWDALLDMLDARNGVLTRRVNLDELAFETDDAPPPYTGAAAEVGRLLGATRLGYAPRRARAGRSVLPQPLAYARRRSVRRMVGCADAAHAAGDVRTPLRRRCRISHRRARRASSVE